MNSFILLLPLILIRYLLLYIVDSNSLSRAAFIPPMIRGQKVFNLTYQISTLLIIFYPCFLKIVIEPPLFYGGLIIYGAGIMLCIISTVNFAKPGETGINIKGLYRFSRNPVYVAYFLYFLGCVLLTRSLILLVILIVFQVSTHWVILAEENWCKEKFGNEYIEYMEKVRRYI